MYSITDSLFWLSLIGIYISFFIAFYIPGYVIVADQKIKQKNAVHVIAITIGIALWAWQGYIFGQMHLRWLSYLYLLTFAAIFVFKKYYQGITFPLKAIGNMDKIILFTVIIGAAAQIMVYIQMGILTSNGVNRVTEDHVWHAGLIRELIDRFPPNEPGMAGIVLKDYHYWFNLTTAEVIRVFHLPALQTQFIGMYVLASVLLAFLGYYFAKLIYDNKLFLRLFLFFLFFCGDTSIWLILLLQHKLYLKLDSLIINGTKFVDSPAFAFSILIGLTGYYLLFQTKEKLSKKMIIVIALLFGSLMELKIYTGITFMMGLASLACYSFFKKRFDRVAVFIFATIFGAIIFFPNTSSSGSLFFLPLDIPRDFITQKVLGFSDWELRWFIYKDHANYLRIIQYGIYMSVLYFFVQFGIQLIGLFPNKKIITTLSFEKALPFYTIVITGIFLGLFFYQKVGGANIWEFFLPVGIVLSLLAALNITLFLEDKNKNLRILIIIAIIIFVIPRWLVSVGNNIYDEYLSAFHGISMDEYQSYVFLEHNVPQNDVVMVLNQPYHVAYVSVAKILSGSQFYLSGEGVRQIVTPEIVRRRAIIDLIEKGKSKYEFSLLKKENVKYLYFYGTPTKKQIQHQNFQVLFHNKAATIVRINS